MDVEKLRAAAEVHRKYPQSMYETGGHIGTGQLALSRKRWEAACLLADAYLALLDARPIMVEGLVEAGFTEVDDCGGGCRWEKGPLLFRRMPHTPDRFVGWLRTERMGWTVVCPEVETMGDVHTLLLRLARGME